MPDEHAAREESRRRSPGWMRALTDSGVHGLAGRTLRRLTHGVVDEDRAEWVLEAAISELGYRARRDRRAGIRPCSCQWCVESSSDDGTSPF